MRHSSSSLVSTHDAFDVHIVPCLSDNYAYIIVERESQLAMLVDPVDAAKVHSLITKLSARIKMIACTHHHQDHAGGNIDFLKEHPGLEVMGFDNRVPGLSTPVADGHFFRLGSLYGKVIHTPCHTSGSICFLVSSDENFSSATALFTGDTLFIAGCGRFFEGSASQMMLSLAKIATLPADTKIYVGHEYTIKNLEFAHTVEPDNAAVITKLETLKKIRDVDNNFVSVPSTTAEELETNPFLRVRSPQIKQKLGLDDPVSILQKLREMKDVF